MPDLPVWILTCEDATYRVRLIGNMLSPALARDGYTLAKCDLAVFKP